MQLTGLPPLSHVSIPAGTWATLVQLDAQVWLVDAAGRRQALPGWPQGLPRPDGGVALPVRVLAHAPLELACVEALRPSVQPVSAARMEAGDRGAVGETAAWRPPALAPWQRPASESLLPHAADSLWPFCPLPLQGQPKARTLLVGREQNSPEHTGAVWCVFADQAGHRLRIGLVRRGAGLEVRAEAKPEGLAALEADWGAMARLLSRAGWQRVVLERRPLPEAPLPGHGARGRGAAKLLPALRALARHAGWRAAV